MTPAVAAILHPIANSEIIGVLVFAKQDGGGIDRFLFPTGDVCTGVFMASQFIREHKADFEDNGKWRQGWSIGVIDRPDYAEIEKAEDNEIARLQREIAVIVSRQTERAKRSEIVWDAVCETLEPLAQLEAAAALEGD